MNKKIRVKVEEYANSDEPVPKNSVDKVNTDKVYIVQ